MSLSGELNRDRLYQLVCAHPGAPIRRLAHISGLSWHTCEHHLHRLQEEGRVCIRRQDGFLRVFDKQAIGARDRDIASCLYSQRDRRLAELIIANPGATQEHLAKGMAKANSTASRHIRRLWARGLVEVMPDGRRHRIFPSPALEHAMATPQGVLL